MALVQSYSSTSDEQGTWYETALLKRALPNLVHARHGQQGESLVIPKKKGATVSWRKFGALSAVTTALVEGVRPASTDVTVSAVTTTVAQYGAYILHTDWLDDVAKDKNLTEHAIMLGEQAGLTIDTLTRDVLIATTTIQYASTATQPSHISTSMVLSALEIAEGVATLETANCRRFGNGFYVGIVHPKVKYDMIKDTTIAAMLQNSKERGPKNPYFTWNLGEFMGVEWWQSSLAKIWLLTGTGSPAASVYGTLMFGEGAFGVGGLASEMWRNVTAEREEPNTGKRVSPVEIIYHAPGSSGIYDALDQQGSTGWKTTYAARILDQSAMLIIKHGATL